MQRKIAIKNHIQEIQLISKRVIIALVFMVFLVLLLGLRLGFLQLVKQDLYTTLSKKNWLDLVPLEPTRGLIFDRNGVLIAENVPIFDLDIVPYQNDQDIPSLLANLSKIIPLSDDEIAEFHKELKQHRRFDEITLKTKLTEQDVARFYENQYRFPGLFVRAKLLRHYPLGETMSQVLGYVGRISSDELEKIDTANYSASNYLGKAGIEKFYEDKLHGTVGYEQAENDASGEPVRILKEIKPVPGKNLYLSIDTQLQLAAEKALKGHRGALVAIQPSTGQILALVSEPSFDPNLFVNGISSTDFQKLQNSVDRPLFNRAVRGIYPLASTIKPYLGLKGLDDGFINSTYTIDDPGWFQLPNSEHIFKDWKHQGHGIVNINKAIMSSCDVYFYELAAKMGIQRIDTVLNSFGFGSPTGIDLSEEVSGVIASPAWKRRVKKQGWYPGDTINSAIGQGYMQATPIQLATAVATLANHGNRITPHLLYAEQNTGGPTNILPNMTLPSVQLKNPHNWDIIIHAMQAVTSSPEGTGYSAFANAPYSVAAKTGTAQVFSQKRDEDSSENQANLAEHLRDHHLLIAFAPVENPQIAIAVITENVNLPLIVARQVLDSYLIKKTNNSTPDKKSVKEETHEPS